MCWNQTKFQVLRVGKNEDLKNSTFYLSADNEVIEEKETLRDLGITVNNQGTFDDHISNVCVKVKQKF